jgi:anti-sigma regulatory factor (Ser/Thr protein kinase)
VCDISPENIPDLRVFCEQWAVSAGLAENDAYQVVLAFDEILTNVYKHAYKSRPGPVRCDAAIDLTSLRFVITHWGIGLSSAANIPPSPQEARPGGYGLPFVRRVFDEVAFEGCEGHPTIRLARRIIPDL